MAESNVTAATNGVIDEAALELDAAAGVIDLLYTLSANGKLADLCAETLSPVLSDLLAKVTKARELIITAA